MSSGPQGPGNRAGGTGGKPRLQEERGVEGACFPWEIQENAQELRTSQCCGSCQYIEGHFPNCDELGELGQHCLGAAPSMKEYSRRDGNSFIGPGQTRVQAIGSGTMRSRTFLDTSLLCVYMCVAACA